MRIYLIADAHAPVQNARRVAEDVLATVVRFDEPEALLVPAESNAGDLAVTAIAAVTSFVVIALALAFLAIAATIVVAPPVILVARHFGLCLCL